MAAKRKAKSRASSSRIKTSGRKLSQSKLPKAKGRPEPVKTNLSCPIVGIGGSAGGFEAAMDLSRQLPPKTERKHFEEKIQRPEELYRTLFDLVPVAVYVCDADGIIQEYN